MKSIAYQLHEAFNGLTRFHFPFEEKESIIPQNGIYCLFEKGEHFGPFDRIVRIGSHTGKDRLLFRLKEHFLNPNKDRSIFRKNIGLAMLNKANDPYIKVWKIDMTPRATRLEYKNVVNKEYQAQIEEKITAYIQENMSFCVIPIKEHKDRVYWESKLIPTLAQSSDAGSSQGWLGHYSPKEKIRKYGMWQEQLTENTPMNERDLEEFFSIIK
jgi:hypothetical protein